MLLFIFEYFIKNLTDYKIFFHFIGVLGFWGFGVLVYTVGGLGGRDSRQGRISRSQGV